MSRGAGAVMLMAAGAALWLYTSSSAGEQDVASTGIGDALGQLDGAVIDLGSFSGAAMGATSNRQAFLDMVALSELGAGLLAETDNGYNVLVGATPSNPLTFDGYDAHPDILNRALNSTAAGRYQINFPTFKTLMAQTGRSDFSPETQDAFAIQLCANKGALADIDAGNIQAAIAKCAPVWASLPGWTYGQHTNSVATLTAWFQQSGGVLA